VKLVSAVWLGLISGSLAIGARAADASAEPPREFPRLLGMNIGKKIYDDPQYQAALAKLDVVILGFTQGWNPRHVADPMGDVLRALKRLNPRLKIGQYTILNESYANTRSTANREVVETIDRNHWWLRNAAGQKVQWTTRYHAWEVNFSAWAPPDAGGRRYPEWRAQHDNAVFFQPHPELDIWYVDNVMQYSRVKADWDLDGHDDNPREPRYATAFREGQAREWAAIRALQPQLTIMGNTDSDLSYPEYRKKLDAAFLEGWMGKSWSIEKRRGWSAAMAHYRAARANLPDGAILGVNVAGRRDDYPFFRYAYASCLLDDGYFSFADDAAGYSSVVWFDEYDVKLGAVLSAPPMQPWQGQVWRRDFAHGVVLVNPTTEAAAVTLEPGLAHFRGKQASDINDGAGVRTLTLAPRDGVVLVRVAARP